MTTSSTPSSSERAKQPPFFSGGAPQDAFTGAISGVGSILGGVGTGLGSLIAAPIAGGVNDGARGFGVGLATGVTAAVTAPIAGAVMGTSQIISGIVNTPNSINEAMNNRVYDSANNSWVARGREYDLAREAEEVFSSPRAHSEEGGGRGGGGSGGGGGDDWRRRERRRRAGEVKDTKYYDVLGVDPTATPSEIKRAYYNGARATHPDKNPGDPTANEKFVALGESYQVLSNERLRAIYDKKGVAGTNPGEMGVVDSHVFFTMLFGSERFEPYIGQLSLSNMADVFLADGDLSAAEIHNIQVQREVRCALNLASLLSRFVAGDELAFAAAMKEQACLLINAPFGETLVRSIGFIYKNKAEQFLGDHDQSTLFLGGHAARMVQQGRIMHTQLETAGNALSALTAMTRIADAAGGKVPPTAAGVAGFPGAQSGDVPAERVMNEETAALVNTTMENSMPAMLQMVWSLSRLDVEKTLRHVCDKVLNDHSVPFDTRHGRAVGLEVVGGIFLSVEAPHDASKGVVDAKQHFEYAMKRTAARAAGMEDYPDEAEASGDADDRDGR